MRRTEPRLQRKLLAWLLGPLLLLLALDAATAYFVSLRFANLAYDRALNEVAREIALHVRPGAPLPRLELSEPAARVLLTDAQDRLFFRVDAADGTLIGGDAEVPRSAAGAAPRFYGDQVHGEAV